MEATAPRTGPDPRRWWALALLCGAFFMVLLDATIVLVALNEGFQAAFVALVVLAGIGAALALLLLGRPRKAPQERLEAAPVPVQND